MQCPPLVEHDLESLARWLGQRGYKPSHARRVLRAFYAGGGRGDFDELEIGKALAREVRDAANDGSRIVARHVSSDGTIKLLIEFPAGGAVEAVLMPTWRDGIAAGCVSSQIGCAMGCDFCASGQNGLERNLSAGEIVTQFLHLRRETAASSRRLRTLVFMGMGEPLHNLDAVLPAIERIAHPDMGSLGWRQITVSTVGIVPGIERLAAADLKVHLALSLHAPDDATRARLVPMNRAYRVAEIMSATRRYADATGRVPNIEYCLIAGVNDSDGQATQLAELMAGFRAHVNVIPYNPITSSISGADYRRPSEQRVQRFVELLRERGVVTHVRVTRGDDVSAACGQLRRRLATLQPPTNATQSAPSTLGHVIT